MESKISGLVENLKYYRKKKGFRTQKEAAARIGIPTSSLGDYETGQTPSVLALMKIADAYGVSVDTLVGRKALNIDGLKDYQIDEIERLVDMIRRANRE